MTTSSFKNTGSYKKETEPPTLKPLAPRPVDECSPFLTAWPPTPPSLRAPLLGRDWTPGLPLPLNKAPQSRQNNCHTTPCLRCSESRRRPQTHAACRDLYAPDKPSKAEICRPYLPKA